MNKILGIVTSISYYHRDFNGNFLIDFTMQVDRSIYIFGEIKVQFISPILLTFIPGEKVETYGELYPFYGYVLKVFSVSKLSIYS